jgi:hypothetical protein
VSAGYCRHHAGFRADVCLPQVAGRRKAPAFTCGARTACRPALSPSRGWQWVFWHSGAAAPWRAETSSCSGRPPPGVIALVVLAFIAI